MATPSTTPTGPSGWVRGPKPPAPPVSSGGTAPAASPAPVRRTAPAPAPEPSWGEPRRGGAARGGAGRGASGRGKGRDEVGWVQAHGGAGATSLVEVLGGVDLGVRWPKPGAGEPRRVVIVGRTSARGLRAVSQALGALKEGRAPQGLELIGVVLVADAPGRLPLTLLRRIRVLRSVTHVHRVPWIPAWRLGGRVKSLPRQLVSLAELVGAEARAEEAVS